MNKTTRKLPGTQRMKIENCFIWDDVFDLQMEYRDFLLSTNLDKVFFNWFETIEPVQELLDFTLCQIKNNKGYCFEGGIVTRPDGISVNIRKSDPLISASRLVQEDILLLEDNGSGYILKAGVLCFPASWTLAEKKGKSLTRIHNPVTEYDDALARRIERMFKGLKPGIPIWRSNFLLYDDYELFQPRLENEEKGNTRKFLSQFMRVERQSIFKLPKTNVVAFTIHTFVVPYEKLSEVQKKTLALYTS